MGSATIDWPSLCSLFALAISAVTSAEEVKVLVRFSGDCGAGGFANATAATRVKARLMIILRIKPPSVLRLTSASYASPALDTTICPRNQGEPDPPPDIRVHRELARQPASHRDGGTKVSQLVISRPSYDQASV